MNRPGPEIQSSHRLRAFLLTSISDSFTVERICRCIYRGQLSLYTIFTAKHYFDRVSQHDTVRLMENPYLVFISCVIISSKVYMDLSYTNISWTELCHFPVAHLNKTERIILKLIDYDVIVPFPILEKISLSYGSHKLKKEDKKCGAFRRFLSRLISPFMCIN